MLSASVFFVLSVVKILNQATYRRGELFGLLEQHKKGAENLLSLSDAWVKEKQGPVTEVAEPLLFQRPVGVRC